MFGDHDGYLVREWVNPRSRAIIYQEDFFSLVYKSTRSMGELIEDNTLLSWVLFCGASALFLVGGGKNADTNNQ